MVGAVTEKSHVMHKYLYGLHTCSSSGSDCLCVSVCISTHNTVKILSNVLLKKKLPTHSEKIIQHVHVGLLSSIFYMIATN